MIVYLHGPRGRLDHRDGPPRAAIDAPDDVEVDPERDRAKVPADPGGDPPGWQSGVGLILHARAGRFGLSVLHDGYAGADRPTVPSAEPPAPPFVKRRHSIPRDLASCRFCCRLVLVAHSREDVEDVRLVEPSRMIAASVAKSLGVEEDPESRRRPPRAGVPHLCFGLIGG